MKYSFEPGSKIDKYEVIRPLGEGGMGQVYLCRHPWLDELRAIKVLRSDLQSEEHLARTIRDAQTLSELNHPSIVRFFDFGMDPPHIIMEYCEGDTLSEVIRSRSLQTGRTLLDWVEQICRGLEVAHAASIYHRDLKPANIMFKGGVVKLVDFGLAKRVGGGKTLTTAHGVMGTPEYMSPEQFKNPKNVSGKTDLWALGVTLFELFNWGRPFDTPDDDGHKDLTNIMFNVVMGQPRPYRYPVPAPLQGLIERALEKELESRISSASRFREQICEIRSANEDLLDLTFPVLPPDGDANSKISVAVSHYQTGDSSAASSLLEGIGEAGEDTSVLRYWLRKATRAAGSEGEDVPSTSGDAGSTAEIKALREQASQISNSLRHWGSILSPSVRKELESFLERAHTVPKSMVHEVLELMPDMAEMLRLEAGRAVSDSLDQVKDLLGRKEFSAAREILERILNSEPKNEYALELMAKVDVEIFKKRHLEEQGHEARRLERAEDFSAALGIWQRILEEHPDHGDARQGVARVEVTVNRREHRKEAVRKEEALRREDDLGGAIQVWKVFLDEYPHDEKAEACIASLKGDVQTEQLLALENRDLRKALQLYQEGEDESATRLLGGIGSRQLHADVDRLKERIRQRSLGRLRGNWQKLKQEALAALESGRYACVSQAGGILAAALREITERGSVDDEHFQESLAALRGHVDSAEAALSEGFDRAHAGVCRVVEEALDYEAGRAESEDGGMVAGMRRQTLEHLARMHAGSVAQAADPVGPMEALGAQLAEAIAMARQERSAASDASTAEAAAVLLDLEQCAEGLPVEGDGGLGPELLAELDSVRGALQADVQREQAPVAVQLQRAQRLLKVVQARREANLFQGSAALGAVLRELQLESLNPHGEAALASLAAMKGEAGEALAAREPGALWGTSRRLRESLKELTSGEDQRWTEHRRLFQEAHRRIERGDSSRSDDLGRRLAAEFEHAAAIRDEKSAMSALERLRGLAAIRESEQAGRLLDESGSELDELLRAPGSVAADRLREAVDLRARLQGRLQEDGAPVGVDDLADGVSRFMDSLAGADGAGADGNHAAPLQERVRRHNESFHPHALQRYEKAWQACTMATRKGGSASPALKRRLRSSRAALLKPSSPVWRAAIVVLALALASGLGWAFYGKDQDAERHVSVVISDWRDTGRMVEVQCDGKPVVLEGQSGSHTRTVTVPRDAGGCAVVLEGNVLRTFSPDDGMVWLDPAEKKKEKFELLQELVLSPVREP